MGGSGLNPSRPPLRRRRQRLRRLVLAALFIIAAPAAAWGAMAVIDSAAIAKLGSQLSEMRKMLDQLTSIQDLTSDVVDSTGLKGKIDVGLSSILGREQRRYAALLQDPSKMHVNIRLPKGMEQGDFSTAESSMDWFRKALTYQEPKKGETDGPATITRVQEEDLRYRRQSVYEEAALAALAAGGTGEEGYSRAIDEIQSMERDLSGEAETVQQRLAQIGALLVYLNTQQAQANLLAAQQLRLSGAQSLSEMPTYLYQRRYVEDGQ